MILKQHHFQTPERRICPHCYEGDSPDGPCPYCEGGKSHQVKFPNFKKHVYDSGITEFSREFEDHQVTACFYPNSESVDVSIFNEEETIFEMTGDIHLEEFEMVLKNRNIEITKKNND